MEADPGNCASGAVPVGVEKERDETPSGVLIARPRRSMEADPDDSGSVGVPVGVLEKETDDEKKRSEGACESPGTSLSRLGRAGPMKLKKSLTSWTQKISAKVGDLVRVVRSSSWIPAPAPSRSRRGGEPRGREAAGAGIELRTFAEATTSPSGCARPRGVVVPSAKVRPSDSPGGGRSEKSPHVDAGAALEDKDSDSAQNSKDQQRTGRAGQQREEASASSSSSSSDEDAFIKRDDCSLSKAGDSLASTTGSDAGRSEDGEQSLDELSSPTALNSGKIARWHRLRKKEVIKRGDMWQRHGRPMHFLTLQFQRGAEQGANSTRCIDENDILADRRKSAEGGRGRNGAQQNAGNSKSEGRGYGGYGESYSFHNRGSEENAGGGSRWKPGERGYHGAQSRGKKQQQRNAWAEEDPWYEWWMRPLDEDEIVDMTAPCRAIDYLSYNYQYYGGGGGGADEAPKPEVAEPPQPGNASAVNEGEGRVVPPPKQQPTQTPRPKKKMIHLNFYPRVVRKVLAKALGERKIGIPPRVVATGDTGRRSRSSIGSLGSGNATLAGTVEVAATTSSFVGPGPGVTDAGQTAATRSPEEKEWYALLKHTALVQRQRQQANPYPPPQQMGIGHALRAGSRSSPSGGTGLTSAASHTAGATAARNHPDHYLEESLSFDWMHRSKKQAEFGLFILSFLFMLFGFMQFVWCGYVCSPILFLGPVFSLSLCVFFVAREFWYTHFQPASGVSALFAHMVLNYAIVYFLPSYLPEFDRRRDRFFPHGQDQPPIYLGTRWSLILFYVICLTIYRLRFAYFLALVFVPGFLSLFLMYGHCAASWLARDNRPLSSCTSVGTS
eukprot:g1926.t1